MGFILYYFPHIVYNFIEYYAYIGLCEIPSLHSPSFFLKLR